MMRASFYLAVVFGFSHLAGAEEIAGTFPEPAAAQTFQVGATQVTVLHDGRYVEANDGASFGADVGAAAVSELLHAAGVPTDRITLSVNVLLVRTGQRVLLLDTGLGPKDHGGLVASLKVAGVSPVTVTDVLITHTHGDHVGGLVDAEGHPIFPNATVRMASGEWTWFQAHGPAQIVKAIASQVQVFEPGARIAPGVRSVALNGHTPGHMGYEIVSGSSRLLDVGDLAHSSIVSLQRPQWENGYDQDKVVGKATRKRMLARLAKDHELVFSPHFPYPGVGHIAADGAAFTWVPQQPDAL